MNHLSSSKNNVWPCVLGGVAVGAAGALALAHAWRPASCQPQGEKKKKSPRRGLRVAVVLSGCGVYDGAEVQESAAALFHLSKSGAAVSCFAPDKAQHHVVDHTKGAEMDETRNVLVESARIARGEIAALASLDAAAFDALVIPGGFGAAKNLCNHATVAQGDKDKLLVEPSLERAVAAFAAQGKPIGLCCIAPVIAAALLPGVRVTVGCAEGKKWPYGGTVEAVKAYGGVHEETSADGVCVDASRKVVTSCAYMFAGAPHEIYESVGRMVEETLGLC